MTVDKKSVLQSNSFLCEWSVVKAIGHRDTIAETKLLQYNVYIFAEIIIELYNFYYNFS